MNGFNQLKISSHQKSFLKENPLILMTYPGFTSQGLLIANPFELEHIEFLSLEYLDSVQDRSSNRDLLLLLKYD